MLTWRKSSYSNPNGACVEMASDGNGVTAVRDSTDPGGPRLMMSAGTLGSLLRRVRTPGPAVWCPRCGKLKEAGKPHVCNPLR